MRKVLLLLFVLLPVLASAQTRFPDVGGIVTTNDVTAEGNLIKKNATQGSALNIKVNTVTTTTDSGAGTETITGLIPAGATCLSVTCYVGTILAGSGLTTWSLGDGTDADLYGTALTLAAGTTVDHSDYTASPLTQAWSASAGNLTMTAAAGQFDSGSVTCSCFYIDTTAPTS